MWVCILNWVNFSCGFRFVYKIRLELWDIKFKSNGIYFNLSCFGLEHMTCEIFLLDYIF